MLLIWGAAVRTTEIDPGPARLGIANGVKAMSNSCGACVEVLRGAEGAGNSIRKPMADMIRPPAARRPGMEIRKNSMIAEPSRRNTTRIPNAYTQARSACRLRLLRSMPAVKAMKTGAVLKGFMIGSRAPIVSAIASRNSSIEPLQFHRRGADLADKSFRWTITVGH